VSGALAERVFVKKLENVGFTRIEVIERHPLALADAADYPLFTPDLIELMTELLPPDRHTELATSITVQAHKPA
jgi:arsenite methyltransferase